MVDYSDADRVAADYERSEHLAQAWERGEDTSVVVPGTSFAHGLSWTRKVNLLTGDVSYSWEKV